MLHAFPKLAKIYQNSRLDPFFFLHTCVKTEACPYAHEELNEAARHHADPSLGPCGCVEVPEAQPAKNINKLWNHRKASCWSAVPPP